MSEIRLSGIENDSITDGPGLRFAVFVQGCPRRCAGCHNPQSQDFEGGTLCDVEALMVQIRRNPLISCVTLSGGEPMCQAGVLAELASCCRAMGLEVAVYTGYTLEELLQLRDPHQMLLLENTDVLIDGPFILEQRSLDIGFLGSRNQRILDASASLQQGKPVLESSVRWNPNPVYAIERRFTKDLEE